MLLPLSYPASFTSACCIVGTLVNELRSIPVPDNILSVAGLLLYSGVLINNNSGDSNSEGINSAAGDGLSGALATSIVLFLLSLPRVHNRLVPVALFAATAAFYASALSQYEGFAFGVSQVQKDLIMLGSEL